MLRKPMRIGITCYPTFGGSGVVATELARALGKRSHEVHLISYAVPGRLKKEDPVLFHQVDVPRYPLFECPPYALALASKIGEVACRFRLDIIHAHYAVLHAVSAILARKMLPCKSLKVITTLHGTDTTLIGKEPSFLPIVTYALGESDAITAVSHYLKEVSEKTFNIKDRVEVIYNFVDSERFKRIKGIKHRRRFAEDDEAIIVHISNFRPVKRVLDVVKIFRLIREKRKARLLMVGDGPERIKVEEMLKEYGLSPYASFLGEKVAVEEVLGVADLFLLPSELESFGLSALEAMSCEVPVIASKVGGIPEVVIDGETGFLAPKGAISEMAEKALVILGDQELKRKLGETARTRAKELFSPEQTVDKYEALYRKVSQY